MSPTTIILRGLRRHFHHKRVVFEPMKRGNIGNPVRPQALNRSAGRPSAMEGSSGAPCLPHLSYSLNPLKGVYTSTGFSLGFKVFQTGFMGEYCIGLLKEDIRKGF